MGNCIVGVPSVPAVYSNQMQAGRKWLYICLSSILSVYNCNSISNKICCVNLNLKDRGNFSDQKFVREKVIVLWFISCNENCKWLVCYHKLEIIGLYLSPPQKGGLYEPSFVDVIQYFMYFLGMQAVIRY